MNSGDSPNPRAPNDDEVRAFYDRFSDERTKNYVERANPRIEKAIERILPLVGEDSAVLEIGCGAGLVAEQIARKAGRGSLWGCDISDKAIAIAKSRVKADNVHFRALDAAAQFAELKSWVPQRLDLVVMVDVIEHLPLESHAAFFRNLADILHSESAVVLTFPSPDYQRYLRDYNPAELQIIDESIELLHLHALAVENGLFVKDYALVDVWLPNQYVHCVLKQHRPIPSETAELTLAADEIAKLVAPDLRIILVDDGAWAGLLPSERKTFPFIERDGVYWGPPADDEVAVRELERLREAGAKYIIFARPSFWWLDHYANFHSYLRENYSCVFKNEQMIAFRLGS